MKEFSRTEREFLSKWIPYFHFDLKPGMQMMIDADLNEGTIDENQAAELRELVDYLSQRVDEFYEQNNLSEFSESVAYDEEEEENESADIIRIALNKAMDMEREFLSDNCLDDYESIDELDDETLETLDSEELKKFYDLKDFKSAISMVYELVKARDESTDSKKLHKIRKDFELAIRDLRGIKRAKNDEAVQASSIAMIMDDLIQICKDDTKRAIVLEERQKN